ncbi:MAG: 30S ribosome-binding factor RbfA, partial [Bacilli bacterium]
FIKEISIIVNNELKDEKIKFVTITGCEVSNDLSFAKVYFTSLNENKKEQLTNILNKAAPYIRSVLSQRVDIRHTPELKFYYDESIDYGRKIEDIIEKIHEKSID